MSTAVALPSGGTALERKYMNRMLTLHPGLGGEKSKVMANILADSGIPAAATTMLIGAVYAPNEVDGRGQGTRAKWFVQAVQDRYGGRIEKIKNDVTAFRTFVAEIAEVAESRDILQGEGLSVSFHEMFLLTELGYDGESVMSLVADMTHLPARTAARLVVRAAVAVKSGKFNQLETAIAEMNYAYRANTANAE